MADLRPSYQNHEASAILRRCLKDIHSREPGEGMSIGRGVSGRIRALIFFAGKSFCDRFYCSNSTGEIPEIPFQFVAATVVTAFVASLYFDVVAPVGCLRSALKLIDELPVLPHVQHYRAISSHEIFKAPSVVTAWVGGPWGNHPASAENKSTLNPRPRADW